MAPRTQPGGGCARSRAAHWLGHVILFPGGAGRADRGRHRLAAQYDCRRRVARPSDCRADLATGRTHDCRAWRPAGPGGKRASVRGRPLCDRAGAGSLGLSRRLDRGRRRDGNRPLRCGLCRARPALRRRRTRADHRTDIVRRICQHRLLAARRLSCRDIRLAQRLLRLCRAPPPDRAAALADLSGWQSGCLRTTRRRPPRRPP